MIRPSFRLSVALLSPPSVSGASFCNSIPPCFPRTSSLCTTTVTGPLTLETLDSYVHNAQHHRKQKKRPVRRKAASSPGASVCSEEKKFSDLKLSLALQQRLAEQGLTVPTDVQTTAIPVLLQGSDAAVQSYTGSGKTLAYLLPILTKVGPLRDDDSAMLEKSGKGIEAVVVAPSRELAMQIVREAEKFLGAEHKRSVQQLVGGANRSRQEEALKKNKPVIVVGTPGRISEISRAGKLHTHGCRFLVLDEADELLSITFREDMRRILEHVGNWSAAKAEGDASYERDAMQDAVESATCNASRRNSVGFHAGKSPKKITRQTILVSATMPLEVLRAASAWGHKPLLIRANSVTDIDAAPNLASVQAAADDFKGAKLSLPPSLQHYYSVSQLQHKVDALRRCIHALDAKSVIVFMNHSQRLKDAVFKLDARGIAAASLHGELGKLERSNTLSSFKSGKLRVLVTSEVGARGLDVPDCDLVVNLELPTDSLHYAHRAGRTGRLGRKGVVVSICEEKETFIFKKFSRHLDISIERCELLEGKLLLSKGADSRRDARKEALAST